MARERKSIAFFFASVLLVFLSMAIHGQGRRLLHESQSVEKSTQGIEEGKGGIGSLANGPSPKGPGHQSPTPPALGQSISITLDTKATGHNKEKSMHGIEKAKGDIGPFANGPSPKGSGHQSPTPPALGQSISITLDTMATSHNKEKSMHGIEKAKGDIGPFANGPSPKGPGHQSPAPPPLVQSISLTLDTKVASHNKEKSSHGLEEAKGGIGPLANGPSPRGPGHESPTPPPLVQSISLTWDTKVASHNKEKSSHGLEEAKGGIGPLANGPSPRGPVHKSPTPPPLVQSISLTPDMKVASHNKEKSMHGREEAKGSIGPLANGPSPKGPGHESPTPPPLGGKP